MVCVFAEKEKKKKKIVSTRQLNSDQAGTGLHKRLLEQDESSETSFTSFLPFISSFSFLSPLSMTAIRYVCVYVFLYFLSVYKKTLCVCAPVIIPAD